VAEALSFCPQGGQAKVTRGQKETPRTGPAPEDRLFGYDPAHDAQTRLPHRCRRSRGHPRPLRDERPTAGRPPLQREGSLRLEPLPRRSQGACGRRVERPGRGARVQGGTPRLPVHERRVHELQADRGVAVGARHRGEAGQATQQRRADAGQRRAEAEGCPARLQDAAPGPKRGRVLLALSTLTGALAWRILAQGADLVRDGLPPADRKLADQLAARVLAHG